MVHGEPADSCCILSVAPSFLHNSTGPFPTKQTNLLPARSPELPTASSYWYVTMPRATHTHTHTRLEPLLALKQMYITWRYMTSYKQNLGSKTRHIKKFPRKDPTECGNLVLGPFSARQKKVRSLPGLQNKIKQKMVRSFCGPR